MGRAATFGRGAPQATAPAPENHGDGLLPHERALVPADAAEHRPDPLIEQAHRDIERGLVDTDLRATPGLDAGRRRQLLRRSSRQSAEVAGAPEGEGVEGALAAKRGAPRRGR